MLKYFRKTIETFRMQIQPPEPDPDRNGLAIVAIAKNEEAGIGDWLAFHHLAGARKFFIYDNQSTDRTREIARSFSSEIVTVIPWHLNAATDVLNVPVSKQTMAYCHAICTFGADFSRMAFIDLDEYIVPKKQLTILESIPQHVNVSLPWTMFGHNGHETMPSDALPFAFTQRAHSTARKLLNFKCIVDPCAVSAVGVHKFDTTTEKSLTSNSLGSVVANRDRNGSFITRENIQLNHYYLKSREGTLRKIEKGDAAGSPHDRKSVVIKERAEIIESSAVPDESAVNFLRKHGIHSTKELREYFSSVSADRP